MLFFLYLREFANFVISRPGGGSDHQTGFRNGKLRRFAIGAVYHFFLWDGMSEKLEHFESANEKFCDQKFPSMFFIGNSMKIENFEIEKFSIFFRSKIFVFFNWIFNEKFSMKKMIFYPEIFVGRFKML